MPLPPILSVTGRAVHVPGDDIDTDRIIPARFMKCVTFDGLGQYMFYDVRYDEAGQPKPHPLNDPRFAGASILVSGNNFGCGSSREHAPQSIYRAGFRGIIAGGFAEIFFGNSITLGMPCVTASPSDLAQIAQAIEADPNLPVTIDVAERRILFGEHSCPCGLRDSARTSLLEGRWDAIGDLLDGLPDVDRLAASLPYLAPSPAS
ncbi:MAG: 3-isopropylmalate dehydratase small subunit [Verrucomicrobiia bacterium]